MKITKRILLIVSAVVICFSSMLTASVSVNASTKDEAILSQADDKFTPLYTTAPDSSLKEHKSADSEASKNYKVFYSQTTFLALLAGYLIIFKVKGIDHSQKMHRKSRPDED